MTELAKSTEDQPPIRHRLMSGTIVVLLSFLGSSLWLRGGRGDWIIVGLVPAAVALVLAFASGSARLVCVAIGLAMFLSDYLSDYDKGSDNPLSLIPIVGLCIAITAILVEVFLRGTSFRRRRHQRA